MPGLISPPDESKSADKPKSPDVNAIAAALGNPRPFSAEAAGSQILIYSSGFPLTASDTANLSAIERSISNLAQLSGLSAPPGSPTSGAPASSTAGSEGSSGASSPASAYALEVPVPHANSFSSLASTLNGINPDIFSVQAIGSDRIRIKSTKTPSCRQVTQFLQDVRHTAWQMYPESPVAQEYHLAKVEDFVSAFSGKGGTTGGDASQSANQGGGGNANPGQSASNQGQSGDSNATKSGQGSSQGGSDGASGGQGDAGGTASSSSSAPGAKAATASSSTGSGDTGTTAGSASQTSGLQSKPSGSSGPSTQSTAASVHLITPDLFLFLDQSPGNDGDISEKKRILAQVDLPRPEVLLNVWSMQLSTTEPTM